MPVYYFIFVVVLTLCSCQRGPSLGPGTNELLATAAESDCGFVQNAYGQRVSWKKNIPVTLRIHKNFPPEHIEVLQRAIQHWNEAAGMILLRALAAEDGVQEKPIKNATNEIYWLQDWPEQQKNQQALTYLYWRESQLFEADLSIDNKYFNFYIHQPSTPYDVHLESLLIHELGHVLGLKHRSTLPSVMWAYLSGAVKRDSLSATDRETLKCEY